MIEVHNPNAANSSERVAVRRVATLDTVIQTDTHDEGLTYLSSDDDDPKLSFFHMSLVGCLGLSA